METLHSDVNFNKWRSRSFVYGNKKSTKVDKVSLLLKKNTSISTAPIEHTPILYINVKRKMGTFKLMMP
jgi:hypothetical protein